MLIISKMPNNKKSDNEIIEVVEKISDNYTKIISKEVYSKYSFLRMSGHGTGDRWSRKLFIYTVIYGSKKKKPKLYLSDNDEYKIDEKLLDEFYNINKNKKGIIGVFIHSLNSQENRDRRPISKTIRNEICKRCCVICGTSSEIICDHKNDLYNDINVLNVETQTLDDFQPLCNHCNLRKRQVCKEERENKFLYSSKLIPQFNTTDYEYPWEKKTYDEKDPNNKKDTYWYDPIEFNKKISLYTQYTLPIIKCIKKSVKLIE